MKKILTTIIFLLVCQTGWCYTTVSSNLTGNTTWSTGTYYISANVTAGNNGYSLTIDAGVVVKLASGVQLSGGPIIVNGVAGNPVYFTSKNDNTVGDIITGSSGSPSAGDWQSVGDDKYPNNTGVSINYAVVRYSVNGVNIDTNANLTDTITNTLIKNCSVQAINLEDNGGAGGIPTVNLSNSQIDTCVNGITRDSNLLMTANSDLIVNNTTYGAYINYGTTWSLTNDTFDNNGTAILCHNGTAVTATNTIISNNAVDWSDDQNNCSGTWDHDNKYNNTTTSTTGLTITNPISGNPTYQTGTAATGYIGEMTYFLTQASSPDVDSGSASSSSLGMNTLTTNITAAVDSGTVDVGYHYNPSDVTGSGGTVNHGFTRFL